MTYEARLITPFKDSGLQQYYKPFLIGQEAFPDILDAYAWRGRVIKRDGFRLLGKLPSGGVNNLGGPVMALENYYSARASNTADTLNTLIAFNTTKAFKFTPGSGFADISFLAQPPNTAFTWTGGTTDYYWSTNFAGSLWVTNTYNTNNDPLRFMNSNFVWGNQTPTLGSSTTAGVTTARTLKSAFICIAYKGRLVLLNTLETTIVTPPGGSGTDTRYQQRARWSQLSNPYVPDGSILSTGADTNGFIPTANAWRDDIPGRGGFLDADTNDYIVSAAIIRDVLIVFFNRSTWRLRYSGNENAPFIWERINTQYGSESVRSTISFDDHAKTFSRFGWIKADPNSVEREDLQIPDVAFQAASGTNLTNLRQVYGARDYYRELAYWIYPADNDLTFPDTVYNLNYRENLWSKFKQEFKCFGYFRNTTDWAWNDFTNPPDTWENQQYSWISNLNIGFPFVCAGDPATAGNTTGAVYEAYDASPAAVEDYTGISSFQTNFGFSITTKQFNPYFQDGHRCKLGYVDVYVEGSPFGEITVQHFIDDQNSEPILTRTVQTYPTQAILISSIMPGATTTIITSSPHDLGNGTRVFLNNIQGSIGADLNNQYFTVTVVSQTSFTITQDTNGKVYTSGGYVYIPETYPSLDARYVRIFLGAIARFHTLVFTMSSNQISDTVKGTAKFSLLGFVMWTRRCGRLKK